jgi:hypothetical protein
MARNVGNLVENLSILSFCEIVQKLPTGITFTKQTTVAMTYPRLQSRLFHTESGSDVLEMTDSEHTMLSASFHPFSHTAKIDVPGSKRSFKIEQEGFLRNKTVIKNEYGIKVGELGFQTWYNNEGFIDLNQERFHYTIKNVDTTPELVIYKTSVKEPLLTCTLDAAYNNSLEDKEKYAGVYASLLMALSWYLFVPTAERHTERQFAA